VQRVGSRRATATLLPGSRCSTHTGSHTLVRKSLQAIVHTICGEDRLLDIHQPLLPLRAQGVSVFSASPPKTHMQSRFRDSSSCNASAVAAAPECQQPFDGKAGMMLLHVWCGSRSALHAWGRKCTCMQRKALSLWVQAICPVCNTSFLSSLQTCDLMCC
jgi:hypothetical protein